ncbi:MAG: signal peptidase I [Oscillospiraceae bacterium]|jgi:signal peptidase|nr:signal peptidase I [Oscillospiraceae bacterium]
MKHNEMDVTTLKTRAILSIEEIDAHFFAARSIPLMDLKTSVAENAFELPDLLPPLEKKKEHAVVPKISTAVIVFLLVIVAVLVTLKMTNIQMRTVLTSSMEPERPVGSLLFVVPVAFDQIIIGDDLCYKNSKGEIVTHRVVQIDSAKQQVLTKGIANGSIDSPVGYTSVIGAVRFCVPFAGYPMIWLNTTLKKVIACAVFLLLAGLAILIFSKHNKKAATQKKSRAPLDRTNNDRYAKINAAR